MRDYVGWVEVVKGCDALNWVIDEYLLAVIQADHANRSRNVPGWKVILLYLTANIREDNVGRA